MSNPMQDVMIQMLCYAIIMAIVFIAVGLLQKGFFFKYLKVRLSFGRLVLIKIRSKLRDHYAVGWVDEKFLVWKGRNSDNKKVKFRVMLPDDNCFYKSLAVMWIDIDESKKAICTCDYSAITGFNAEEFSNLYERALTRPQEESTKEKMIDIVVFGIAIGLLLVLILLYKNYQLTRLIAAAKGIVVGGGLL